MSPAGRRGSKPAIPKVSFRFTRVQVAYASGSSRKGRLTEGLIKVAAAKWHQRTNNKHEARMGTFSEILEDVEGLNRAFKSIRPSMKDKWLVHLEQLYSSADGEESRRSAGNNVVQSETRNSCSKIGGLLTGFFEGEGAHDTMMWIGFIERDENRVERWVMRPEIRASLQSLNWFGPGPSSEKVPNHSASATDLSGAGRSELAQREARFMLVEVRQEQDGFRRAVFKAYGGACAISGCRVPEVLEAAHLEGRKWREGNNAATDGILLRRDFHALYDRGLLSFDPEWVVRIDPRVVDAYGEFQDVQIFRVG